MRKRNLRTEKINPRPLYLANGENSTSITKIVNLELDINGYKQTLCGYVVPNLACPMILGKPWLEHNNVVYLAKRHCLRFGSRKNRRWWVRACGYQHSDKKRSIWSQIGVITRQNPTPSTGSQFAEIGHQN